MPDRRSELRAALHREDGAAVVAALTGAGFADDVLQLAGDAPQIALAQHVDGAESVATACVNGGRIDRHTGEVWHTSAIDDARGTGEEDDTVTEDPDRRLWVDSQGSRTTSQASSGRLQLRPLRC